MATLTKTAAGRWKAVIRRQGWPTSAKTWRTKRDAEDWARRAAPKTKWHAVSTRTALPPNG